LDVLFEAFLLDNRLVQRAEMHPLTFTQWGQRSRVAHIRTMILNLIAQQVGILFIVQVQNQQQYLLANRILILVKPLSVLAGRMFTTQPLLILALQLEKLTLLTLREFTL
jgi:hypothetical protein